MENTNASSFTFALKGLSIKATDVEVVVEEFALTTTTPVAVSDLMSKLVPDLIKFAENIIAAEQEAARTAKGL